MRKLFLVSSLLLAVFVMSGSSALAGSYGDGYGGRCGFFETPNSATSVMRVSVTKSWSDGKSYCQEAYDVVEQYRLNNITAAGWSCTRKSKRVGNSKQNKPVVSVSCSKSVTVTGATETLVASGVPSGYLVSTSGSAPLQLTKWISADDFKASKLKVTTTEDAHVTVKHYLKCRGKTVTIQEILPRDLKANKETTISLYRSHEAKRIEPICGKGGTRFVNYVEVTATGESGATATAKLEF